MLTKILSHETCADCRICCTFDNYDVWETPVINDELKQQILDVYPEQKFISFKNSYLFRMEKPDDQRLFYCPMLSDLGCVLGDRKPFDCKIWPFRVMKFEGRTVITLSPICPSVYTKPVSELVSLLRDGLAVKIIEESKKNPDIIKDYINEYPILYVE